MTSWFNNRVIPLVLTELSSFSATVGGTFCSNSKTAAASPFPISKALATPAAEAQSSHCNNNNKAISTNNLKTSYGPWIAARHLSGQSFEGCALGAKGWSNELAVSSCSAPSGLLEWASKADRKQMISKPTFDTLWVLCWPSPGLSHLGRRWNWCGLCQTMPAAIRKQSTAPGCLLQPCYTKCPALMWCGTSSAKLSSRIPWSVMSKTVHRLKPLV